MPRGKKFTAEQISRTKSTGNRLDELNAESRAWSLPDHHEGFFLSDCYAERGRQAWIGARYRRGNGSPDGQNASDVRHPAHSYSDHENRLSRP